jgi:hypothetical protein
MLTNYVQSHGLAVDRTPFDAVTGFIREGGIVTPEVVAWLRTHGCTLKDVGRFLRWVGVTNDEKNSAIVNLSAHDAFEVKKGFASEKPPTPMPERSPDWKADRQLVALRADDPATRTVAPLAWQAIAPHNEPSQLFRFGAFLVWVEAGEGAELKPVTVEKNEMKFVHNRTIRWQKTSKNQIVTTKPPDAILVDMLADPHPPVPRLVAVRPVPVFGPSGELAFKPGYDRSSGYFIWPDKMTVPFVSEHPTAADIAKARHLIETEVLGEFPFDSEASKAHAVAAMVLPFVRAMIDGPTPLHAIIKPAPGTGGTLLADAITHPSLGRPAPRMSPAERESEWSYTLLAKLRTSPVAVVFDNVTEMLKSSSFSAALTGTSFEGRVVGTSGTLVVPVQNLWLATGNNLQMSRDIARRATPIYLDANHERPEERVGYKHDPLIDWCDQHRGELVWAVLTLVQAWKAAGRPPGSESLGSFEKWSRTLGGILAVAGIPGFLANLDKVQRDNDAEGRSWASMVAAWAVEFGTRTVGAGLLQPLAERLLSDCKDLSKGGRSAETAWGKALRAQSGRVYAGYKIVDAGTKSNAAQWRLAPVGGSETQLDERAEEGTDVD